MNFEELSHKVILWGIEKGIFENSDTHKQLEKTAEEVEEALVEARLYEEHGSNDDFNALKLELGDVLVTIVLACEFLQVDPKDCLEVAYNKISKRKGEMRNGVFVKSEDL